MKKLFFLSSCIVLLTGCVVAPDDGYSYSNNIGYYGVPSYYERSGVNRYNYRSRPSRPSNVGFYANRGSRGPDWDREKQRSPRHQWGKDGGRYQSSQWKDKPQKPLQPNDQHRPPRDVWNQNGNRPMNSKPSRNDRPQMNSRPSLANSPPMNAQVPRKDGIKISSRPPKNMQNSPRDLDQQR